MTFMFVDSFPISQRDQGKVSFGMQLLVCFCDGKSDIEHQLRHY